MTHAAGLSELRPTAPAEPAVVPLSTFEVVCRDPADITTEDAVTRQPVDVGRWIDRGDGTWALRITVPTVDAVDVDGKVVTLHVPGDWIDPDVVDEIAQAYLDHGALLVRTSTGDTPPITATVTDPADDSNPGGRG